MPDLHKISTENTQWLVEHALRKFPWSIFRLYLENSWRLDWRVLSSSSEMSVLTYFRSFTYHGQPYVTLLSDLMLNEVMIPAEEKYIDLSLFTYCYNQTEHRMQGKPTNSKFGECWKNQFQGLKRIEKVLQVHIIKSLKFSNYFSYILQLFRLHYSVIGKSIDGLGCGSLYFRLITYNYKKSPDKLNKLHLGMFEK